MAEQHDFDYIIIGSGFGGSVSALRLAEKGYKVLVMEKGKRLEAEDFPETTWNLKRWMWMPRLGMTGLFKLTFFRHVAIASGVGVGGGSLVYANTLPVPTDNFFKADSWSHLADWKSELEPYYPLAKRMLGAKKNPNFRKGDRALQELARQIGKEDQFQATDVAVYFGEPEKTVTDPYFGGKGPDRTGCKQCGGCMTGCRYNSKNTLDKNYLHLAEQLGVEVMPESEVCDVLPMNEDGSAGYTVKFKNSLSLFGKKNSLTAGKVIFAGGVLGTVDLLLKLKEKSLTNLSEMLGRRIRTNSESLIGVTTYDKTKSYSEGIAIGSILHTDENSHLEPVRYREGSGFWRILMAPMVSGSNILVRFFRMMKDIVVRPVENFKIFFVDDWAKRTQILLFMQTIDSTLRFKRGIFGGMASEKDEGKPPTAFIPEAQKLAEQYGEIMDGKPMTLATETLLGIPTTAHILGGCPMGKDISEGVIDKDNYVFGYKNMMICDGSAISANPGVNPSLTITALTERAMELIEPKAGANVSEKMVGS
ncbi:MAG: GMC family oxidoreductase [Bacteroidetes bacterium]|nr:GMC family oxidoreductase [Bacteroidota bacterium]